MADTPMDKPVKVIAVFKSKEDQATTSHFEIPFVILLYKTKFLNLLERIWYATDITPVQLEYLINSILKNEELLPYSFFVRDFELKSHLSARIFPYIFALSSLPLIF